MPSSSTFASFLTPDTPPGTFPFRPTTLFTLPPHPLAPTSRLQAPRTRLQPLNRLPAAETQTPRPVPSTILMPLAVPTGHTPQRQLRINERTSNPRLLATQTTRIMPSRSDSSLHKHPPTAPATIVVPPKHAQQPPRLANRNVPTLTRLPTTPLTAPDIPQSQRFAHSLPVPRWSNSPQCSASRHACWSNSPHWSI